MKNNTATIHERVKQLDKIERDLVLIGAGWKSIEPGELYKLPAWRWLRERCFETQRIAHGYNFCERCGSRHNPLQADHIKPLARYPRLALVRGNIQILCCSCNARKGARNSTDWRGRFGALQFAQPTVRIRRNGVILPRRSTRADDLRRDMIVALRRAGRSFHEIAGQLGMRRQDVMQELARYARRCEKKKTSRHRPAGSPPYSDRTAHRVEEPLLHDYALLIGANEDHEGAAKRDCDALAEILKHRGYKGRIRRLGYDATKQSIKAELRRLAQETTDESHTFFYFHGHGGNNGIIANGQVINPKELYSLVRKIRGKKAVVIEACRSGRFLAKEFEDRVPENTTVIVACEFNRNAGEALHEGEYRGKLNVALCGYLNRKPGKIDIAEFKRALDGEISGATIVRTQQARAYGAGFTLQSVRYSYETRLPGGRRQN